VLDKLIKSYIRSYPEDKSRLELLLQQLARDEDLHNRGNYTGHVTASTLIYSPDLKKVLIIYHPTFERWQQPGGHLDPDENPRDAAEREAIEETGIKLDKQLSADDPQTPLLIESHSVPTKPPKNEPLHYHHAFWYCFQAASEKLKLEDEVIKEARWAEISEIDRPVFVKAIKRSKEIPELKA
jgi:8-oxo-dGTP pyrophosphatase MutT (NUDIX family)